MQIVVKSFPADNVCIRKAVDFNFRRKNDGRDYNAFDGCVEVASAAVERHSGLIWLPILLAWEDLPVSGAHMPRARLSCAQEELKHVSLVVENFNPRGFEYALPLRWNS